MPSKTVIAMGRDKSAFILPRLCPGTGKASATLYLSIDMRITPYVWIGFLSSRTIVQGLSKPAVYNEPADFNATAALIQNGVDVSSLTDLINLKKLSLAHNCAVAVSRSQDCNHRTKTPKLTSR
jgi:hypothetical protein